MKKFIELANHIITIQSDSYLSGHPEWLEIVKEAKNAIASDKRSLKISLLKDNHNNFDMANRINGITHRLKGISSQIWSILHNNGLSYRSYTRSFSGRMTKGRYKILDRFCRTHSRSPRYRCGHEHDCCGCLCGQRMDFIYSRNQVTISLTHSYNY